jgi:serine/threonine protein kinase/formylglycine-generating enzyme required for sulfatase activity
MGREVLMASDSVHTQPFEESWGGRKDRLCDDFEDAWRRGCKPRIEDYVCDLPEPQRGQLLSNLLGVELELRLAGGEKPTFDEYERRFPLDAALVRTAFVDAECQAPEWIDRFQVLRSLGGGGFGRVFLCYDDKLYRQVALKVPRRDRLSSAEARERFLREARNVAGLHHEAIVTLHEFGETEGQCYLVYEYIAGGNLAERLKQSPLSHYQAAKLTERIADALQHAHGEDIYHRDIKPANILLDQRGQPYLTDFGLAVRVEDLSDERGLGAGTAPYMAPELVRGDGDQIDGRADIYSLGVVLYELLTGRRPFEGRTRQEIYAQIVSGREPRPPREIDPGLRPELQEICLKAMARSVSGRYLTAGDLADKLHWAAEMLTRPEATPRETRLRPEPPPQPSSSPLPVPVLPKGLRSFGPEDRAFFLELLPGPRDAQRLPESVRFWKLRVESADADTTFTVGLIYGPSGCGKSSLVKAGLLPVLSPSVAAVYVEATRENTEGRLLGQLRRRCPGVGPRACLRTTIARLRQSRGLPAGVKLLIVLDQFEQWLLAHAHDMETTELVAALRQTDGVHVQTLLLVRSDFWMSISRLFDGLRINLDRAHNARAVDLFGEGHAHHVLHLFGTAYGQLPRGRAELTKEQTDFLALVVRDLSADGDVIPVRLSLFAEMMKKRPWTPAEFAALGGMKGIGRKFLEEIFSQPALQASKTAAQAVLRCLLPAPGADLKGRMRSQRELAEVAQLAEHSPVLAQLLANLYREYLLTPTDAPTPAPGSAEQPQDATPEPHDTYYQLTHDYLVPALREWLAEEKGRTWKGWAELRLAERSALWNARPQNSLLPAWWEWASVRLLTRPRAWTLAERRLMRRATLYHLLRACVGVVVLALVGRAALEIRGSMQAQVKVSELLAAPLDELPAKIEELAPYQRWANRHLLVIAQDQSADLGKRRNANLALLPAGLARVDFLKERLLVGDAAEVRAMVAGLQTYHPEVLDGFWITLQEHLLKSADLRSAAVLVPVLMKHEREARAGLEAELQNTLTPDWKDAPLKSDWSTPEESLLQAIQTGHGLIDTHFAFCQTMALADFLRVADRLRPCGYRPFCVRPYADGDTVRVAAVWTRDGGIWELLPDASAAEIGARDLLLRQKGYAPVDITGYPGQKLGQPRSDLYLAVWAGASESSETILFAGVRGSDQYKEKTKDLRRNNFTPDTQSSSDWDEHLRYSAIWRKEPNALHPPFHDWGQDLAWFERNLSPTDLLTDVRLSPNPRRLDRRQRALALLLGISPFDQPSGLLGTLTIWGTGTQLAGALSMDYAATWRVSSQAISAECHGLDPDRHLVRARELAAAGYRPVSFSVASVGEGMPLVTASAWRQPVVSEADKEELAIRQARAAVILLRLGSPAVVWQLLRSSPDPRVRSYVIHLLARFGADPQVLVARLKQEQDVSVRRAILLALGEFPADAVAGAASSGLVASLVARHRNDPDCGTHAAVEWLLRRWGHESEIDALTNALVSNEPPGERQWYVNSEGHTLVVVRGPVAFSMGSPGAEPDRFPDDEGLQRVTIARSFALATKEVTAVQFARFLEANPAIKNLYPRSLVSDGNLPAMNVSWFEAVQYCRWLSEREGIAEPEMCYPRLDQIGPRENMPAPFLEGTGYRLPLEAEWEYAARAGAVTSRFFGAADAMLPYYAWYIGNSDKSAQPVGRLKPNDLGLFDILGNVGEWCQDQEWAAPLEHNLKRPRPWVGHEKNRVWRGGAYYSQAARVRSAMAGVSDASTRVPTFGFRIARTLR